MRWDDPARWPHGGLSAADPEAEAVDLSTSVHPFGPPPGVRAAVCRALDDVDRYPDPFAAAARRAAAAAWGVDPQRIVAANGTAALIHALPQAAAAGRVLVPAPGFGAYGRAARSLGRPVVPYDCDPPDVQVVADRLRPGDLVFLTHPTTPWGTAWDLDAVRALAQAHPRCTFAIDEAFVDFTGGATAAAWDQPNAVVLRSLTKFYAVPGLRIGFAAAAPDTAASLFAALPPWCAGHLDQQAAAACLEDQNYARATRQRVRDAKERFQRALDGVAGVTWRDGVGPCTLVRTRRRSTGADLARRLRGRGVAVRALDDVLGADTPWVRVALPPDGQVDRVLDALDCACGAPVRRTARRRTPALMVQGTCSDAGKSVLVTALCRILLQDGWHPAPFKAQNMSLNAYAARGGEMGWAQAVQAMACRREPVPDMNPVLLKPSSDTGAQVVLRGKAVGSVQAGHYREFKGRIRDQVHAAYRAVADSCDAVIIEGAGSPAEINLRDADLVNMDMAHHAGARVLVVGDIDRGGVFASFVGTWELLLPQDRSLLAGFVINKFRGDASLLEPALRFTTARTGVPVLGVIPWVPDVGLPQEDSVCLQAPRPKADGGSGALRVAVVHLPHISNFTDFDALGCEPELDLRYARTPADLDAAHLVILPGSKNPMGDTAWLRETRMADAVQAAARRGTPIVGICGGLQILGRTIADPGGVESDRSQVRGLGLLPVDTVLAADKVVRAVGCRHNDCPHPVRGYEIHHGHTRAPAEAVCMTTEEGAPVGYQDASGTILGTYVHGLFDQDGFRRWFVDRVRAHHGMPPLAAPLQHYDVDAAIDRMAAVVRRHLDMDAVYRALEGP